MSFFPSPAASSMSDKQLRFKSTVEEYPPETTPPADDAEGPTDPELEIVIHKELTPAHHLALDFSYPTAISLYHEDVRALTDAQAPVCTPPCQRLRIRIAAPHGRAGLAAFEVTPRAEGGAVEVADVLTKVQMVLRESLGVEDVLDEQYRAQIERCCKQRLMTVNSYSNDVSLEKARENTAHEGSHIRRVDHLLGRTAFAGFSVRGGQSDPYSWQLHLEVPARYAAVCDDS
ncbi:hypothetical protein C8J57DRAFT_255878 [Mycena rebaudengoi]|nr:hypothetical protein C8J57DRAFT_255878 [Mycena rebaudengoi]